MKIAFVTNVVYPFVKGGAEKRVYEIGRRLADRGHDVTIYGRKFWSGPDVREQEGMTLRGVSPERELYVEGRRSIGEAVEFAKDLIVPLRKRIDEHDLVVASVFPYFPVLSAKLTTILSDTPLVTTWHEVWLDYWDEYLGSLGFGGKLVERAVAAVPQRYVAVSAVTADRLTSLGPSRDEIEVIHNGIDVDSIRNVEPAADGFDILFAGRLIEDKRVDILLEAFDRVAEEYDVDLGIIGDGPEAESLRQQASRLDHDDRVTFLGFLEEHDEVISHMRAAPIFASLSTREGFGITYAEAMAAGCQVIGADHPESAASEVIDDAGFLAEPSVDATADTLSRVLSGERPPKSPGEVAERFDWSSITDQVEGFYASLVKE